MFAIVAALGVGWAFHCIGKPGWSAAAATAAARVCCWVMQCAVATTTATTSLAAVSSVIGLALLIWLTNRDRCHQRPLAAPLTVPATGDAVRPLAAPDLIEQLVFVEF